MIRSELGRGAAQQSHFSIKSEPTDVDSLPETAPGRRPANERERMSTRHQKSFVVAAFVAILFSSAASMAAEGAHNLILIIPEALPANGVDQSNAPALARLRREGVTFTNSHSGSPRLTPADSFIDTSDLRAEALVAAATDDYHVRLIPDDQTGAGLQQLVNTTLPQAKSRTKPFFVVYQLKEPKGLDNSTAEKDVRPAFKPNPRAINTALDTIE